jgi:hypothetical protein
MPMDISIVIYQLLSRIYYNNHTNNSKKQRGGNYMNITPAEMLSLRDLLGMEMQALTTAKASEKLISHDELKTLSQSTIHAIEARILALQKFIEDNDIIALKGVQ